MTDRAASPARRHILSSFNPDNHSRSPERSAGYRATTQPTTAPPPPSAPAEPQSSTEQAAEAPGERKPTRLRFKSSKHSSRRHRSFSRDQHEESERCDGDDHGHDHGHRHKRRRRHHHHYRRRRRRRSRSPTPPDPFAPAPLDADAAFRESLFDAMADDEGAAYWEGVYGQPIHVYGDGLRAGPAAGGLERMSEDEYAAHVRQKMWERTHAGLLEERARRARARECEDRDREEQRRIAAEMERSLRAGEERRRRKADRRLFEDYVGRWGGWASGAEGIPWPVVEGPRRVVDAERVRGFFIKGLDLGALGEKEFAARLKEERIRWHPDKIQQKLGGKVDEKVMKDVTAIFQIIDKLWTDTRSKSRI